MFRQLIAVIATLFCLSAYAAVDVNQATRADLETVKGIGPGLSGKIIEARKAGPFKDWNDLVERVGGVGPGNATRLSQAGLTVGGGSYEAPAAAPKPEKKARAAKAEAGEKAEKAPKKAKKAEATAGTM